MKRTAAQLAAVLFAGCVSLPISESTPPGPYGAALDKATRRATLYSSLETRAFVRATYLSPEFITAQAAEISRLRAEPAEQAAARLARMREENKAPGFFVALHTPEKSWNDWNEPNSVWRLAADVGKGEIDKPKIQRVERPDAETLALYPYLDSFSVGYVLRFEGSGPAADGGRVRLMAAGALGQIRLEWAQPVAGSR